MDTSDIINQVRALKLANDEAWDNALEADTLDRYKFARLNGVCQGKSEALAAVLRLLEGSR